MYKNKIIAALEAQPGFITHRYSDGKLYCALGAMAVHANIPLPDQDFNGCEITDEPLKGFAAALSKAYQVSIKKLEEIQNTNDCVFGSAKERRNALILFIKNE